MIDHRIAVTVLVLCAGCRGVAPDLTSVPHPAPDGNLEGGEFPGADALLEGFDERSANAQWETGDQVLFGLRLRKGGEVQRWLLHLQVDLTEARALGDRMGASDPNGIAITLSERQTWTYTVTADGQPRQLQVSSPMLPVKVTVASAHGATLGLARVTLPARLLSAGLLPAVDLSLAPASAEPGGAEAAPFREEQVRPMVEAVLAMMSLLNVVREDQVLADYFWQVVEKPSVWSVITRMGISTSLRIPFEKSVPAEHLPAHVPPGRAFVVPLQVNVNDNPALLVDIVATGTARPLAVCGGMVAATARHPTDPSVQFEVVLLAARLGATTTKPRIEMPASR